MLLYVDKYLINIFIGTDHLDAIDDKALLINQGLNAAKHLSRFRGIDPSINLKYITKIADVLSRVSDEAKSLLNHKQFSRYQLLTSNPSKFMAKMRRSQAMMPKNWGRKEIRYR